jgi:hypothetical protein
MRGDREWSEKEGGSGIRKREGAVKVKQEGREGVE